MNEPQSRNYRILITGAAGAVGRAAVAALLPRGHHLRSLDPRPHPDVPDHIAGSISDPDLVDQAMTGVDTLIHLAAVTDDADFFSQLLPLNIVALYQVLDAARRHGLRRVILASSVQATGHLPRPVGRPVAIADGALPNNMYAVTKLFAENTGQVFAARHHMSIIATRIGWLPRNAKEALALLKRHPHVTPNYLSWDDAGRFFVAAVEADSPGYLCVYVMSKAATDTYDMATPARLLGYHPQDVFPHGLPYPIPPHGEAQ